MSALEDHIIKLLTKAAALRTAQQARDWENIKRLSEEVLTLATFLHELAAGVIENTPTETRPAPAPAQNHKARVHVYPRGEQKAYFEPMLKDMRPGDVVVVPLDKWAADNLRGGIGAYCNRTWGIHSVVTRSRIENGKTVGIEVLRQK